MNLPLPSKTNPEGRPIAQEPPRQPQTRQLGCETYQTLPYPELRFTL